MFAIPVLSSDRILKFRFRHCSAGSSILWVIARVLRSAGCWPSTNRRGRSPSMGLRLVAGV